MGKIKTLDITIFESKGAFSFLKSSDVSKENYNFSGMAALRQLLSNEKARILHVIKNEKPNSIYELSKKLGRNFKVVSEDVKLLQRFGFVDLISEKTKNRVRHKPVIVIEGITLHIKV